jgi:hypothetical protein
MSPTSRSRAVSSCKTISWSVAQGIIDGPCFPRLCFIVQIDSSNWSGEGAFTQTLLDVLTQVDGVAFLRVENAPSTRSDADYNFISNEIYVAFATQARQEAIRRFGFLPGSRTVIEKKLSIGQLEPILAARAEIGPADFADEGLIQYLKTERIVAPYQTRGYKLVELVRLYEAGTEPRR